MQALVALSITTTGETTGGTDYDGIYASITNTASTGTSRLTRPPRRAALWHFCENNGTGALSITTTGKTTGTDYRHFCVSITARHSTSRLTRPNRRASKWHFCAKQGTGDLIITTTGTTTGNGTDRFNVGYDYYYPAGIVAINKGTGALSITTTGDTTGKTFDGIYALSTDGGAVNITTSGAVTGGRHGIYAKRKPNTRW